MGFLWQVIFLDGHVLKGFDWAWLSRVRSSALATTPPDSEASRACAPTDRRPGYVTSTTFFFRLKRSKAFQKQPVHEDVPAAHLAQEDAPGCVVEEADVVQWHKAASPEHDAQDVMLDAGATAAEQSKEPPNEWRTSIIPILGSFGGFYS